MNELFMEAREQVVSKYHCEEWGGIMALSPTPLVIKILSSTNNLLSCFHKQLIHADLYS